MCLANRRRFALDRRSPAKLHHTAIDLGANVFLPSAMSRWFGRLGLGPRGTHENSAFVRAPPARATKLENFRRASLIKKSNDAVNEERAPAQAVRCRHPTHAYFEVLSRNVKQQIENKKRSGERLLQSPRESTIRRRGAGYLQWRRDKDRRLVGPRAAAVAINARRSSSTSRFRLRRANNCRRRRRRSWWAPERREPLRSRWSDRPR